MQYNFDEIINRAHTNCMKYDGRSMIFGREDVLPMWVADMDFKTPDFITAAIRKRAEHQVYGYPLKPGSYYEAIQDWMQKRHRWNILREWITFSPGVVPGLAMAVMATTSPGDKIIIQTPVYFPFFEVIQGLDRELVINELLLKDGHYEINFEELEQLIDERTSAIMLCSPHNPVGRVFTRNELLRMGNLAVQNNMTIISDEIHSDLTLNNHSHVPVAALSEDIANRSIVAMAPSKTFNMAGLATSTVIIPNEEIRQKYNHYLQALHLGMGNIFGIAGLEAAYKQGHEWLNQMLHYIEDNLEWLKHEFQEKTPEIKVIEPEATYLAWLDLRELGMNDKELQTFLAEKARVGLNNGARFGKGGEGFMRINFAAPRAVVEEGVRRITRAVRLHRQQTHF